MTEKSLGMTKKSRSGRGKFCALPNHFAPRSKRKHKLRELPREVPDLETGLLFFESYLHAITAGRMGGGGGRAGVGRGPEGPAGVGVGLLTGSAVGFVRLGLEGWVGVYTRGRWGGKPLFR